jgi:hypothetical protein
MKFQYRKFGESYYVSELHSYNSLTKDYKSEHIGTVRKSGNEWIGETIKGDTVKADTREKASIAMVQELEKVMYMDEQKISDFRNEGKTIEKEPIFTEEEIKVLKEIVKEYENNFFKANDIQVGKLQIYMDLEKVPKNVEHIRSAFNISKETMEELKLLSTVRRIPLQDLAELAFIDLLEKYDY